MKSQKACLRQIRVFPKIGGLRGGGYLFGGALYKDCDTLGSTFWSPHSASSQTTLGHHDAH